MMTETSTATPGATSKENPVKRHRLLKIAGVLLAVLVLVVVLLPYIIPTGWLAGAIEKAAKSHVRGPVTMGGVSWGWLGGVKVENVTIGEPSDFGGGTFLKVSSVSIQVSLLDLLSKKVSVRSVTVDSPEIRVVRNEQGAWNFDKLFAGEDASPAVAVASMSPVGQSQGFDIAVNRIRVKDGKVTLDDRSQKVLLAATGITASVDADFSGDDITGKADVSFDLEQEGGSGRVEIAAGNIQTPKKAGADAISETTASGTIKLTGIDIGEAIATSVPEFGRDLATGALTLVVDYSLSDGKVTLKGAGGQVKNLRLGKAAGMTEAVTVGDTAFSFDATTALSGDTTDATLTSMTLSTAFMDMTASGKANMGATATKVSGKASGTLDPAALPKGLVDLPAELTTSGRAKFDVSFEGTPSPTVFTAAVDATSMRVVYGDVLSKAPGVAAGVSVSGSMRDNLTSADNVVVTLQGGTMKGGGKYDSTKKAVIWNLDTTLTGVNIADYYPGAKALKVSGGMGTSGTFMLADEARKSEFVVDAKFDKLALDTPESAGIEAVLSGAASINSAQAKAAGLVLTVGGMPIAIDATVRTPFEKPTGNVTVRGKEIDVDSLMAVVSALGSSMPAGETPAVKPQDTAGQKAAADKAAAAGKVYIDNANVNMDVAIDTMKYQKFTGNNLRVDAGLVGGKALVRKATVNIFGGTVDLTTTVDLGKESMPMQASIAVAKFQPNELVGEYLSRWLPGLSVSSMVDLALSTSGELGGEKGILENLTGSGTVDISEGLLSLGQLPAALSAVLGDLQLDAVKFPKLNIPLEVADGAVAYNYALPAGKYKIFMDGKTMLAGGFKQKVGIALPGSSTPISLLSIDSGKKSFVDPKEILGDVAKSQLMGVLEKELLKGTQGESVEGQPEGQKPNPEDPIGTILDILQKKP